MEDTVKGKLRHIAISVPDKEKAAKFLRGDVRIRTGSRSRGWRRGFRTA